MSYGISFDSPIWLVLLATIPLVWWLGQRSLGAMGRVRRLFVCALRSLIVALLVLAVAEMEIVRSTDRVAVIYLLDQSSSVPPEDRAAMIQYVDAAIAEHRTPRDMAGVIVFGHEAGIEVPPSDEQIRIAQRVESRLDPTFTDIGAAIKLAEATFPHDAAKRIVLVSDGNQNLGNALDEAQVASAAGIGIDVLPVRYLARSEVLVEKITVPPDIRKGQPFDLRVVVNNTNDTGTVGGRVRVLQRTSDQPIELSSEHVDLAPGKNVFNIRQEIDQPDFYTYEAQFVPDNPADDAMSQNNRATTFTHVRGSGRVLLIESFENAGEHEHLATRLRKSNLEVTVQPDNQLFQSMAELQAFDTVILANVPRSDGEDAARLTHFNEDQMKMLVRNTELTGSGLVMLGGPNSFGAGGWTNTAIEAAMPVDFQVKNLKVVPSGALMIVLDRSGSMSGEKLAMSKQAAIAAVRTLGERDQVGVIAFDGQYEWIVPLLRVGDNNRAVTRIAAIGNGGGTNLMPGMLEGYRALSKVDAAIKHMIVLTDGRTEGSGYPELAAQNRRKRITTSAVAVGDDADLDLMDHVAIGGGGKFYKVDNPRVIPRIFMKEAMRVSRSVIYEKAEGFQPVVRYPHEIVSGLTGPLPPLTGFVRTTLKTNPLVEQVLVAPVDSEEANSTVLATWPYGLGRAVAFTTDDGARWATQWTAWPDYDKFFSQLVRWSMRPVNDNGKFTIATDVEGNRVKVFVTALDAQDEFLNFLSLTGSVVGPDAEPREIKLEQISPGRYVGDFEANETGSYFAMLSPGPGLSPIRAGINVPYSAEFREREGNVTLLESMAELTPPGGRPGLVMQGTLSDRRGMSKLMEVDGFRRDLPPAARRQGVWHLLVFAAGCLFFFDIFLRRVAVSFSWAPRVAALGRDWLLRRKQAVQPTEYMDRLRSRKAEIAERLEQQRAGARFESSSPPPTNTAVLEPELPRQAAPERQPVAVATVAEPPPEESYTGRLLKAKKKVWDEQGKRAD